MLLVFRGLGFSVLGSGFQACWVLDFGSGLGAYRL